MAERRMFAKTIIDSDSFLDMPLSAQCLYFHLSMRADDDGFINNPKKIQRMIGANDDDTKLLIAKSFIIPFDTGVVVIKHWRLHNYIQKDRYKPTMYEGEKEQLQVLPSGEYCKAEPGQLEPADEELPPTMMEVQPDAPKADDARAKRAEAQKESSLPYSFNYKIKNAFVGQKCPICGEVMDYRYNTTKPTIQHNIPISLGGKHEIDNISVICASCNSSIQNRYITPPYNTEQVKEVWERIGNVPGLDTQDRIGKDRIGKVNLSSVSDETLSDFPSEKSSPAPYDKIRDLYNSICKSYPKCTRLSAGRRKAIHARIKSGYTVEDFEKVFQMAEQSRFLKGGNDRNWHADFDWLIKDANMAKVLDGKYQDRQGGQNNGCAVGAGTVAGPAESKKAYGGILILPTGEIIDETGGSEPVGKDPLYDPDEDW